MKKLSFLLLTAVLLAGCATNTSDVYRDKIIPDLEQVIRSDNAVFEAYENTVLAIRAYTENPTDENMEKLNAAAAESDAAAEESASVQSNIGDREYDVMDSMNIPRTDYDYLFYSQRESMENLMFKDSIQETADFETLKILSDLFEDRLELEKVFLVYGAMDLVSGAGGDAADCMKDMIYKYPAVIPENCEWLYSHDEINREYTKHLDEIENNINERRVSLN